MKKIILSTALLAFVSFAALACEGGKCDKKDCPKKECVKDGKCEKKCGPETCKQNGSGNHGTKHCAKPCDYKASAPESKPQNTQPKPAK